MASGYYIALAMYLGDSASALYCWCMSEIRFFGSPVSVVLLGALLIFISSAVPYTLGRGMRFTALLVLVLRVVLVRVRNAEALKVVW